MAGRLAAGRVTGTQLAELDALVQKMEQAVEADDLGSFYPLNGELHAKLIALRRQSQAQQDLAGPGKRAAPLSPPRPGAAGIPAGYPTMSTRDRRRPARRRRRRSGAADGAAHPVGQGAAPQNHH